ncbi:MAG: plastocyanin/azurin family copper-binding protein [Halobacteriales archaeon]
MSPTSTSTPTSTPTPTPTPTTTATTEGSKEGHTVELTDDLKFIPESIEIEVGDTVIWKNVGTILHSVTAYEDKIPDGATYFASGGFESESAARDAFPDGAFGEGETYEHTFRTEGQYEYFCIPHEQIGMKGSVTVG